MRLIRLWPVFLLIPNRRHSSEMDSYPIDHLSMNTLCSQAALDSFHGIT